MREIYSHATGNTIVHSEYTGKGKVCIKILILNFLPVTPSMSLKLCRAVNGDKEWLKYFKEE